MKQWSQLLVAMLNLHNFQSLLQRMGLNSQEVQIAKNADLKGFSVKNLMKIFLMAVKTYAKHCSLHVISNIKFDSLLAIALPGTETSRNQNQKSPKELEFKGSLSKQHIGRICERKQIALLNQIDSGIKPAQDIG